MDNLRIDWIDSRLCAGLKSGVNPPTSRFAFGLAQFTRIVATTSHVERIAFVPTRILLAKVFASEVRNPDPGLDREASPFD